MFCLADAGASGDSHAHPPDIAWRIERIAADAGLEAERRRLTRWREAISRAALRCYRHLILLDGQRTLVAIVEMLARVFELESAPLAEAAACVAQLRHAGVLLERAHYPAEIRVRPPAN